MGMTMASRRRIFDPSAPRPADAPFVCPDCSAALDWVKRTHLTSVRRPCRCRTGHVVHEVRCRACAALVLLEDSATGFVVVGRGHAADDAETREELGFAIEERFERDR